MRKIAFLLLLGVLVLQANAQVLHMPVASAYTRLTAYTPTFTDVFSADGNQASLANLSSFTAGVYSEKRFLLTELSYYQAAIAVPTNSGNFSLRGNYSGSVNYNESTIGFAYGRKLGSKIDIGAQFNYAQIKSTGYGGASAVMFEGGILLHLTEQMHAGIHVYNPTSVTFGKSGEERLPAIYTAGIGYEASKHFFISGEIIKEEAKPVSVNAGMQYAFDEKLFARGGFTSATSAFYFGAGLLLKNIRIDATATVHPQLGLTPGLMLLYNRKDKKANVD